MTTHVFEPDPDDLKVCLVCGRGEQSGLHKTEEPK